MSFRVRVDTAAPAGGFIRNIVSMRHNAQTVPLPQDVEGEAEAKAALAKFAHMDGANRLLGRGILRFDMRDPTRLVVRMPGQVVRKTSENIGETASVGE